MRLALALVAVLLLAGCAQAASSPLGEARVIDSKTARPEHRFEAFDTTKLTLYDLDRDGDLEIVAHNDNNRVVVLDAVGGRTLAELETKHPGTWNVRELNDVAVGDLDSDGRPDIVVANSAGWLTRFELDALASTDAKLAFTKVWEKRVDPREYDPDYRASHPWIKNGTAPSMDGGPYLADVDRDGKSEIFVQTDGWPGHFAFNEDGSLRWMSTWSDGNSNPWVDDLDGDGRYEAVFVTDGGRVYAYDASKGSLLWTFHATGTTPGSISISPGFGDLDGDGRKEFVFATRQAVENKSDPDWMDKQHTMVYAVSAPAKGARPTVLWNVTFPWLNPHAYTHPALVDVDGNGRLDVVTMDWNTIGHKPGNWDGTGKPNLFALDGRTGRLIWKQELESPWNNKDLAVGDVDGDGDQEIVLADPRHGVSGTTLRDLRTGEFEAHIPYSGWGGMRGPQLADVDGDGTLEIVQALARKTDGCTRDLDVGCREGAVLVLSTKGTKALWPGRFTFDAATETGYGKRVEAPRVVVGDVLDRAATSVRVAGGDVESVTVRDGERSVELVRAGETWVSDARFPAGTRVEVEVVLEDGRVVAPRLVQGLKPALAAPRVELPKPLAPAVPQVAQELEARSFDGTDVAVGAAAVAVLAGLGTVAWILRGNAPKKAPITLKRPRL